MPLVQPSGGAADFTVPGMRRLKCLLCTDKSIEGKLPEADIAEAVTLAPLVQLITVGAGQAVVGVAVPVCRACRSGQISKASGNGRLIVT